MIKKLIATLLLSFVALGTYAQNGRMVHGCVIGPKEAPISGAKISTKNGDYLCTTAKDGSFKTQASSLQSEIIVSHADYNTKRVKVDGSYLVVRMYRLTTTYEANVGLQKEARFGWWITPDDAYLSALRFSFIGGKRFNNYLFAGVGAGLDIGVRNIYKPKAYAPYSDSDYYLINGNIDCDLPMQAIAIPIFANAKCYFMQTKVAPYLSFSTGARFSTPKKIKINNSYGEYIGKRRYGAVKPFFELSAGASYRYSDDYTFTFEFGYYVQSINEAWGWDGIQIDNDWDHGLSMTVGVRF